jgi:hypothetical protein
LFTLSYETTIKVFGLPLQWIPKIELYYPDLPQFPIMYIHCFIDDERIIACPVSVSYEIESDKCNATFLVLLNHEPSQPIINTIKSEIENRIGLSNQITLETVINCCKDNEDYINVLSDLWQYIEKSFGSSIPYGRFYEEIYSIPRFVAAWAPKTGRQSEMRMLYNFMSAFGEELIFPDQWSHLEYYAIPAYSDVRKKDYSDFPIFEKLHHSITKLFRLDFTKTVTVDNIEFKVMPTAWKQNKDNFITNVSGKYFSTGEISEEDKYFAEILVDAFNRHPWRAAYFISAFLNIEQTDYRTWNKDFFIDFYDSGDKLIGYSQKVIACFLQQGFANEEIIPIDTWIETFYQYPLGIETRSKFYNDFDMLGKLERVIWLASQSNKTNMKNFFDILWCQRYGTIGNKKFRGVNPLACSLCKLKESCVGLSKKLSDNVLISNTITPDDFENIPETQINDITFICLLESNVPKKLYAKNKRNWYLTDEFSGYLMTSDNSFPASIVSKEIITVEEFINNI